jgi:hypothetical protein
MDATNRLASKYIAVDLNDTGKKLLSDYTSVEPTYKDKTYTAVESRELIEYGVINGKDSVTYSLKLWMDESVTIEDDAMNKSFLSKVSVVASQETFKPLLARYIVDLSRADTDELIFDDETADHNTRYIGANPNNYLCFDKDCTNGYWRVIGVMNNVETEEHGNQSLVKIIRAESIGNNKWDDNNVNDWTTSTLQENLNSGDWWTNNLADYDSLLETVTWNLGGYSTASEVLTRNWYIYERGTTVYSGRLTTWPGKVGLMYPSDYGYATSGGSTTDRNSCLLTALARWSNTDPDVNDCKNNDYLYLKSWEWTLTPYSGYSYSVFCVISTGYVRSNDVSDSIAVRPVGYLRSNTVILSGNGTKKTPWIIGA